MWCIGTLELEKYLNEILDCDAFELHKAEAMDGKYTFYIPYMMNDALECYLMLENGTMTGVYEPERKEPISVELVNTENGPAAIFHQGLDQVFTIWYEKSFCERKCYRYDQIGHFWVEGEEHWRRLVYIVGTMYDKYCYMGDQVCNEKEIQLMDLMGFAPFRFFSPIHESLDAYYEETRAGYARMKALAEEAADREFLRWMKWYEWTPFKRQAVKWLVRAMQSSKRNGLYDLIFEKVQEASSEYPERTYLDQLQIKIEEERKSAQNKLLELGFTGKYPLFHKNDMQILAMEEHPFTILESEHYGFQIQYMVSEIGAKDKSVCTEDEMEYLRNAGFFRKKGNRGWIARSLDFFT